MIQREITVKSALTPSGIGGIDYALNPYVGCRHACVYCYAVFMKRFTGHHEEWGEFVDVRVNAPEVVARQLRRLKPGTVNLGTVTDGYQPAERKYQVSRGCLWALAPYEAFPTTVLTKNKLVLRDLDVLTQMKNIEVAFTVTTLDEKVRAVLEPHASPTLERIEALGRLHEAGIRTWAFFGPALPVFSDSQEHVDALFAALAEAGVGHVLVDALNLKGDLWGRLQRVLKASFPDVLGEYRFIWRDRNGYLERLTRNVTRAAERFHLDLRLAY